MCSDLLDGAIAVKKRDIRNEESHSGNLHPERRPHANLALFGLEFKPEANCLLPGGVIVFSRGAFLNLAVHLLGVRLEGPAQVLFDGNKS